jgi:hypothetical protein
MMDANQFDHNAYSKWVLDWIAEPIVIAQGTATHTLNDSGTSKDCVILWPLIDSNDLFGEFFVVQNRQPFGNDSKLSKGGLMIWHINAALNAAGTNFAYNNSFTDLKLVRLMEADGQEEIEANRGFDIQDLYTANMSFGNSTSPSSKRYNGSNSGVEVSNIMESGTKITATFTVNPRRAAALYSGSKCYFFCGRQYIRVTRGSTGAGTVDPGYPAPISNWGWGNFGGDGIDAALFSVTKCYFFCGSQYIRVTRGSTGAGTVDPGYPAPISNWGWGNFGKNGIDAALYSRTKCYFFRGSEYIRVTRGDTGAGTVDPGYPKPITTWGWGEFGKNGIDAALYSLTKCYFFSGNQYIRVTRGDTGAGTVDQGYPKPISTWGWPDSFRICFGG